MRAGKGHGVKLYMGKGSWGPPTWGHVCGVVEIVQLRLRVGKSTRRMAVQMLGSSEIYNVGMRANVGGMRHGVRGRGS